MVSAIYMYTVYKKGCNPIPLFNCLTYLCGNLAHPSNPSQSHLLNTASLNCALQQHPFILHYLTHLCHLSLIHLFYLSSTCLCYLALPHLMELSYSESSSHGSLVVEFWPGAQGGVDLVRSLSWVGGATGRRGFCRWSNRIRQEAEGWGWRV